MKRKSWYLLLFSLGLGGTLNAAGITQIERYLTVENKPSTAQINPLLTIAQVHFPKEIETVGEALNHWIIYSGYHLIEEDKRSEALRGVLNQKLPQADRNLGPLTIEDGLRVLIGQEVFDLVTDPLHRLVSFELKKKYHLAYAKSKGKIA